MKTTQKSVLVGKEIELFICPTQLGKNTLDNKEEGVRSHDTGNAFGNLWAQIWNNYWNDWEKPVRTKFVIFMTTTENIKNPVINKFSQKSYCTVFR